ncbi:hypothetical protein PHJA_002720500 [Phtheirospermum japonicum]|uniref:Prolamin-like domain-containing protein n=1 Tax=Phtheirospermum japonicum TaxID=374723 RepID=A0A830DCI8_9LAMI|nr:hypothetical protein PHJA_002720500 [Phtheirospermum japonicum]
MFKTSVLLLLLQAVTLILCTSTTLAITHSLVGRLGELDLALPDVQQCLSTILGVPGCLNQLIDSGLRLQPQLLGPPCCKAFLQIDQNCWAKMFPLNPGFPPSLKEYCLGLPAAQPPPNTPPKRPTYTTRPSPPKPLPHTPPPASPRTPPPQSPHKPPPPASPSKPPPHTPSPQSPHKPPPPASPSKPPASSPPKTAPTKPT